MANTFGKLMAGLSERERRLVGLTAVVFFLLLVSLAVFFTSSWMSELEEKNDKYSSIIKFVAQEEQAFVDNTQKKSASTARTATPIPLRTLIDQVVNVLENKHDSEVKVNSVQTTNTTVGSWLINSAEISISSIDLFSLTHFMVEVESHRRKFPIAITRLDIKNNSGRVSKDIYRVKMVISTYERIQSQEDEDDQGKNSKGKKKSADRKAGH